MYLVCMTLSFSTSTALRIVTFFHGGDILVAVRYTSLLSTSDAHTFSFDCCQPGLDLNGLRLNKESGIDLEVL